LGVTPSAWGASYKAIELPAGGSITSAGNGMNFGSNVFFNGTNYIYKSTATASLYATNTGQHIWYNAASGTAGNTITFTQAMTLDASGRLLVGLTSTNSAFGGKLQVEGTSDAFASLVRYSSTAAGNPAFYFGRSKSATLGTNTIVASGDALGAIIFSGANGTGYSDAASIQGLVDGTPGASADMPGRLVFSTSADGSATPTERMRIDSSGNVGIGTIAPAVKFQVEQNQAAYTYSDLVNTTNGGGAIYRLVVRNIANTATTTVDFAKLLGSGLAINNNDTNAANFTSFSVGASERMRIDSSGNVLVTNAGGLGYGTGAGGTVTQATNKSTTVTINKPTGQITMNNAALGAGAAASFSVLNSVVAASDVVVLTGTSSPDSNNYRIEQINIVAGGFGIRLTNITGGSRSEAVVINFAIIKGATT
jgi:hypothetical protein